MFINLFASILAVLMVSFAGLGLPPIAPSSLLSTLLAAALPVLVWCFVRHQARRIFQPHVSTPAMSTPAVSTPAVSTPALSTPARSPRAQLARLRMRSVALSLVGFGVVLFMAGWATTARQCIPPQIPGVVPLLTLAPFLGAILVSATQLSACENRTLGLPVATLSQRALVELRPAILPIAPYLILSTLADSAWYVPQLQVEVAMNASWSTILTLGMLLGVFLFSPFLLSGLFPSRSLEAGHHRQRFEQLAQRAGVGLRDIRIWNTGGKRIVNACIAGPVRWTRFVFLTDALLEELPDEQLDAVFAHELGHARYHHFVILFGAIIAFLFGLQWFELLWQGSTMTLAAITLVGAFVYFRIGFGALSRQLERQADFFSAELLGDWVPTARALEHVGILSGATHRRGWRHPPIVERVEFVARCASEPSFRQRYFVAMRRALAVVFSAFLVGVLALSAYLHNELARPRHQRALDGADVLIATVADDLRRPGNDSARNRELLKDAEKLLLESLSGLQQQRRASRRERRILENLAFVYENLGEWSKATGVRSLLVLRHGFPLDWNAITRSVKP